MPVTFATFDTRSLVLRTISDLRMSISQFAACQYENKINRWTLERILNGSRQLEEGEGPQLEKFCRELRDLRQTFDVAPDWRDAAGVQSILKR